MKGVGVYRRRNFQALSTFYLEKFQSKERRNELRKSEAAAAWWKLQVRSPLFNKLWVKKAKHCQGVMAAGLASSITDPFAHPRTCAECVGRCFMSKAVRA